MGLTIIILAMCIPSIPSRSCPGALKRHETAHFLAFFAPLASSLSRFLIFFGIVSFPLVFLHTLPPHHHWYYQHHVARYHCFKMGCKSAVIWFLALVWNVRPQSHSGVQAFLPSSTEPIAGGGVVSKRRRWTSQAWHMMPHYECATAAVMSGLGDVLAQLKKYQQQKATVTTDSEPTPPSIPSHPPIQWNWKRTRNFMIKGYGEGFLWTLWYRNAEGWTRALTNLIMRNGVNQVWRPIIATVVALLMDLMLACPFIYGFWDIPLPALLRGDTPLRQIPLEVRAKLGDMLRASVKVWTPVNVLIYNAPVHYRAYIMSVADVFWQSIVSSICTSSSLLGMDGGTGITSITTGGDSMDSGVQIVPASASKIVSFDN